MIVEEFVVTLFQQNCRIVVCPATSKAVCIDPGAFTGEMTDLIVERAIILQAIALTHGHLDHVGGVNEMKRAYPEAEIILHPRERALYDALPLQPAMIGFPAEQLDALGLKFEQPSEPEREWKDGETYAVGDLRFEVRHTPGHTPGHVVLVEHEQRAVFVGDCLFQGSIGRSDLPGGDHEQLMASIRDNILSLEDDFTVFSGHGPTTTVGRERIHNPFLNGTYEISRGRFY
jgi:glyoxylase-like metal-dependent hydrolase (beta-lactamase superfamily II)